MGDIGIGDRPVRSPRWTGRADPMHIIVACHGLMN